jgi:hypothetical protein
MAYLLAQWQLQLHDGTPSKLISAREAKECILRGNGKRIKRRAHQPREILRLFKPVPPSNSTESSCSITVNDMRILVGEVESGRGYRAMLRDKVDFFRPLAFTLIVIQ